MSFARNTATEVGAASSARGRLCTRTSCSFPWADAGVGRVGDAHSRPPQLRDYSDDRRQSGGDAGWELRRIGQTPSRRGEHHERAGGKHPFDDPVRQLGAGIGPEPTVLDRIEPGVDGVGSTGGAVRVRRYRRAAAVRRVGDHPKLVDSVLRLIGTLPARGHVTAGRRRLHHVHPVLDPFAYRRAQLLLGLRRATQETAVPTADRYRRARGQDLRAGRRVGPPPVTQPDRGVPRSPRSRTVVIPTASAADAAACA